MVNRRKKNLFNQFFKINDHVDKISSSKISKDENHVAENEREMGVDCQHVNTDTDNQNDLDRLEDSTTFKPNRIINDGVLHSSHEVRDYPSHFPINFEAPQNESTPFLHVESHQNELSYSKYLDSRSDANSLEVTSSQIQSLTSEYDISCEIGNDSVRRYEDKS